jgi:hypothetical protein
MSILNFVRPLDKGRKRISRLPKRESNSSNNIPSKRRPRCVEIGKCMENANLVVPVPMHTEKTNYKRKPICPAISKQRFAHSSILRDIALMESVANFCILFMT